MKPLSEISSALSNQASSDDEIQQAIEEYGQLMTSISDKKLLHDSEAANIQSATGISLTTNYAADCLKDTIRTVRFLRGLDDAVKDQLEKGSRKVHILYAGTGPFATLALPIMNKYSADKVTFTLLEINKNSFNLTRILCCNIISICANS